MQHQTKTSLSNFCYIKIYTLLNTRFELMILSLIVSSCTNSVAHTLRDNGYSYDLLSKISSKSILFDADIAELLT